MVLREVFKLKMLRSSALWIGAVFSALLTFMIFFTAKNNLFVALDDYAYIVNNPNILTFGWKTIVWSFTSFYEGNWHPLTMLSLTLDRCFWGLNPFGFHLTNIIIHSCSVFCSCFLFSHILKASSPSEISERAVVTGAVAASLFFGIHPLRVESVVWASERKDVLCLFFMITSLWMYIRYTIKRSSDISILGWYHREFIYSLGLAALAMLSKPTSVSLPLILCIIDWYPLRLISDRVTLFRSMVEKSPFFVLSLIGAVSTMFAQQIAMKYAPVVDLPSRLLVACKALLFYIYVTIWPAGLTAFYIHPGNVASFALSEYLVYFVIIIMISLIVAWVRSRQPAWTALWLFYVITLVPMLGLVQVGGQWAADRYSYLPSLGLALLWGAGVALLSDRIQSDKRSIVAQFCLILAACQLIFYMFQTVRQISVWRDTDSLATRIIEYYPYQSGAPYLARAIYRNETGRHQLALEDVGEAMKIALRRGLTRTYAETAFVQAVILKNLGRFPEALTLMEWGIATSVEQPPPDAIKLRNELARLAAGK